MSAGKESTVVSLRQVAVVRRSRSQSSVTMSTGCVDGPTTVTPAVGSRCGHLVLIVEAGLTPLEAIHAATESAAQWLGSDTEFGTLEAGKKANFIILEKDPSEDIHNTQTLRAVWKNGIKVSDGPLAGQSARVH